jgi:hypothetical protein
MIDSVLSAQDLLNLASQQNTQACPNCATHDFSCWETILSTFDRDQLKQVGTLKDLGGDDIWDEYHPNGTTIWSHNAPIAVKFHPYARSDVYQCQMCQKVYLRYTEYGGYYVDERIRVVKPELIELS